MKGKWDIDDDDDAVLCTFFGLELCPLLPEVIVIIWRVCGVWISFHNQNMSLMRFLARCMLSSHVWTIIMNTLCILHAKGKTITMTSGGNE